MKSSRTKRFRQLFLSLPQRVQETAKKNYQIWKENPFHPSLEFKEVKPREKIWSVRVGIGWRALGIKNSNDDYNPREDFFFLSLHRRDQQP
ncbi:MAG: hypothetical protein ACK4YL_11155 [Microcystis sp.]|jgi:hypothetical protein|uniref:hypothetical protein n=1 Tax=unclassified Microcystis TaxID=2643300 RepID=UPI00338E2E1E